MKIKYRDIRLSKANKDRLDTINRIIREYQAGGYVLTLRQLYYQLVSRDVIPNQKSEYAKLSNLLKEGRMAGIVDWDAIEDRLRKPSSPAEFDDASDLMNSAIKQFRMPRMKGQDKYVEVWVEKDALSGVLSRVTRPYGIPILVNRGYSSASAMHDAFQRFADAYEDYGQDIRIIYLGDFDPSGRDMIRDIEDRIREFAMGRWKDDGYMWEQFDFEIDAVALTWDQIQQYAPPPNPAKITDPRAGDYIAKYGRESWEVDALRPDVLNQILNDAILDLIDINRFNERKDLEEKQRNTLKGLHRQIDPDFDYPEVDEDEENDDE